MKTFTRFISALLVLLLVFSLAACSKADNSEKEGSDPKDSGTVANDVEGALKDAETALDSLGKNDEWPKDKLPDAMPELTKGKVINWGVTGEEVIIKMEEVTEEALTEYKGQLEGNGWRVSDGGSEEIKATYDLYELSIKYSKSGSVQLWLVKYAETSWPANLLPADFPKFEKGKVTTANKDDDIGLVYIGIEGASMEDALEYMRVLKQKGWTGDEPIMEEGQKSFYVQLVKDNYVIDYDYYSNADGFTIQVMKQ